ncbi:16S rRNA (adenine(1518)-N(6)/adenine(1519)-N(6))-dimethyltransferase [Lacticaseibacillus chiayiensis]|uniref:Ribosomal RNA small subunit methyltransferase A n=1 Tax=Lacticaseibacillus chiayiensis TaxID=2100821 RepID=A0A4Q1UAW3_9LACO|nr:16S rRNA (adenine(1518)-N(6)/adenine(1519)-N(6))-dimethyltransferase RsmA [Lacticaseibacillus chiayiensis]QVI34424.1 16S rRNA (adenine(1518)-N(6)/adenine(1519)-N(6))-dimethyltransferase RsmA [Lacticaseibacillus chiayiensis]RXT27848.1 16S rRNA (adenine(1518)-N(6)/adenine(1519)-N(6))-dimethyltransferase [Lacticaseibacillus chiayiensis]RXT58768.1 16S rRNA (adenine(1518)-N(6)/adenine(1519)-N(6))-dimethyltransferase [Lacticaseibacillus chiayiensis]UYN56160.1 16S rRNA (adenine(1518)-N(6)/adenine(1
MTMHEKVAQPAVTNAILKRHGFHMRKGLGQNFLTDPNILQKIVAAADLSPQDDVIEIGPGIGALTQFLADSAHHVVALEIDERLLPILAETLADYPNTEVVNEDVLKTDLSALVAAHFDGQHTLKVVANLPYYITTPILLHLLRAHLPLHSMTVMMQKEVAARLSAAPGSKDYGSLSIAVQLVADVRTAFTVSRHAFVPAPNVDSAIVTLAQRYEPLADITNPDGFDRLVRGAFASRRKTLWNNLIVLFGKENRAAIRTALAAANIAPETRAEQLAIADFARLDTAIRAEGLDVHADA